MRPRDMVLAIIVQCAERPEFGRTSLQKLGGVAGLRLSVDLGHRAHFFGPYSSAVEADTDALAMSGLVEESVQVLGVNAQGRPIRSYSYKVTDDGQQEYEQIAAESPQEVQQLTTLLAQIEKVIGSFDQQVLSAAAKVLYIAREQDRPVDFDEIGGLALEHGWKVNKYQVQRVAAVLVQLGFAKVTGGGN